MKQSERISARRKSNRLLTSLGKKAYNAQVAAKNKKAKLSKAGRNDVVGDKS